MRLEILQTFVTEGCFLGRIIVEIFILVHVFDFFE